MYNIFIAEGEKVCTELVRSNKYTIKTIYILQHAISKFEPLLSALKLKSEAVSSKEMEQITALKTPSEILILLDIREDTDKILLNKATSAIFLDGVQDPGNVGTIIRIADWYGINAVIRSPHCADFFNPKVVQATMGSMANVHLITAEYSQLVSYGKTLYGACMDGHNLNVATMHEDAILIMGSEGRGISKALEPHIDFKVSIPGSPEKIAESLNVSVATGIICNRWKNNGK